MRFCKIITHREKGWNLKQNQIGLGNGLENYFCDDRKLDI